jgi:hypothetical protein
VHKEARVKYAVIPVEGNIRFEEAERVELEQLYAGTGAKTVEAHSLERDGQEAVIWMDEDYLGTDKGFNRTADYLARVYGGGLLIGGGGIQGDCVLTGGTDDDGETQSLPEQWVTFLHDLPIEARPQFAGQGELA